MLLFDTVSGNHLAHPSASLFAPFSSLIILLYSSLFVLAPRNGVRITHYSTPITSTTPPQAVFTALHPPIILYFFILAPFKKGAAKTNFETFWKKVSSFQKRVVIFYGHFKKCLKQRSASPRNYIPSEYDVASLLSNRFAINFVVLWRGFASLVSYNKLYSTKLLLVHSFGMGSPSAHCSILAQDLVEGSASHCS